MWLQKLKSLSVIYFIIDVIIVFGLWLFAYWARFDVLSPWKDVPPFAFHLKLSPFVLLVTSIVLFFQGLYQPKYLFKLKKSVPKYAWGMFLALVLITAITYFYNQLNYSRAAMFIFLLSSIFVLSTSRFLLRRIFIKRYQHLRFIRPAVLVGSNQLTLNSVLKDIDNSPELGLKIIGYVSPTPLNLGNIPYLGPTLTPETRTHHAIKTILLCPHWDELPRLQSMIKDLANQPYDIHIIFDLKFLHHFNYSIDSFAGRPMLTLNDHALQGFNFILKRGFDLLFSATVLTCGLPIYALISLLIKLTSSGPILYFQKRVGFDGKEFLMPKFRTMHVNAEKGTGAVWATPNDPRVTPIGKLLRRSSLDEIPQFLSVFLGKMSIVGPRPERPELIPAFQEKIPAYTLRNKVKAGITGWAQINGWRGNTSLDKRLEYDLDYIKNWSLLFDLRIIAETTLKGFINKNAY